MNVTYIAIIIFLLACFGLYKIFSAANKFFREADRIEEMIRENKPMPEVLLSLYALKDKSFHRSTGSRLNELAKMAEIKYHISILKK